MNRRERNEKLAVLSALLFIGAVIFGAIYLVVINAVEK